MPSPATLFWSIAFSALGLGYFLYGKKQAAIVPMLCGVLLMVYPYFVSNDIVLVVVGALIAIVPYFVRL